MAKARTKSVGRLIAEEVDLDANGMRDLAFRLRDQHKDLLLVLGAKHDGKALLAVMVGDDLLKAPGLKATDLIKLLATEIKGGGGGQAFYATAGGKDPDGLGRALRKADSLLG